MLDMFASMAAADGVGLAANQIGVDARIFVIDCPDADGEDVVGYVVNPTLTMLAPVGDEPAEEVTEEGCLSVPGPYAELPRAFRARVDGVDVQGEPVSIEATGMAARCLQHEVDHLERHRLRRPAARGGAGAAAGRGGRAGRRPARMSRLVLFDLDGTLVDSAPGIHASVRVGSRRRSGWPSPTPAQLRAMVGPPLQDGFALVFGLGGPDVVPCGRPPTGRTTQRARCSTPRCTPGIPELLARLPADGAILAVATSKPEPFAVRILDPRRPAGRVRRPCTGRPSTAPSGTRTRSWRPRWRATRTGRDPVLVGDRAHDVLGAAAHGLPCIGAGWGPAEDGELEAAGAAAVAATPADVVTAMEPCAELMCGDGAVAGHLTVHDRIDAAACPRPRLQPQGLTGAVQQ